MQQVHTFGPGVGWGLECSKINGALHGQGLGGAWCAQVRGGGAKHLHLLTTSHIDKLACIIKHDLCGWMTANRLEGNTADDS